MINNRHGDARQKPALFGMLVRLAVDPKMVQLRGGDVINYLVAFSFNKIIRVRVWFKLVTFGRKKKPSSPQQPPNP